MTVTKSIPPAGLSGLDVHPGDTLRILEVTDEQILVEIERDVTALVPEGKASEWLRSARGSVRLAPGETVDDVRMAYYTEKYGLQP